MYQNPKEKTHRSHDKVEAFSLHDDEAVREVHLLVLGRELVEEDGVVGVPGAHHGEGYVEVGPDHLWHVHGVHSVK